MNGASGQAAINNIVLLNTISPGTHFFDGIDMASNPIPPVPPSPPISNQIIEEIPQITFSNLYLLSSDWMSMAKLDFQEINYADVISELYSGKKKCVSLGSGITLCASPQPKVE